MPLVPAELLKGRAIETSVMTKGVEPNAFENLSRSSTASAELLGMSSFKVCLIVVFWNFGVLFCHRLAELSFGKAVLYEDSGR